MKKLEEKTPEANYLDSSINNALANLTYFQFNNAYINIFISMMCYFYLAMMISFLKPFLACKLIGNVTGNCVSSNDIVQNLNLCGPYLADYVCIPFNSVYYI